MIYYAVSSNGALNKVPTPRLPNLSTDYDAQVMEQYSSVLRLYFNQVNNILGQLSTTTPPNVYTVATLPSAVTAGKGARSFVSDALTPTFGSAVVTGGAVAVPVYSDGTLWKVG